MRSLTKIFILAAFFTTTAVLLLKSLGGSNARVLSFATEVTPIPAIPTPVPTSEPTAIPTSVPTAIPSPTVVPQPQYSQEQIHGFIERFSSQYGVDPNVMRYIAICESGFNPKAVNGPYFGLYQFGATSWVTNRKAMGEDADTSLRFNAEEAVQTAAYVVSIGKGWVWPNCFP